MTSPTPKVHMEKTHEAIALLVRLLINDNVPPVPVPDHITTSWLVDQIMALYQNSTHLQPVVHLLEHDLRLGLGLGLVLVSGLGLG